MSHEALISIDNNYYEDGNCDFDDLQSAANALLGNSERQFNELKNEIWYRRVFDIATFSQKKNIRLASQIQNLSQAQQIFSQILVIMSGRDKQIFDLFFQCENSISRLAEQDVALAKQISALNNKIILGLDSIYSIENFSESERQILAGIILKASEYLSRTTVDQQTYANGLINLLGVDPVNLQNPAHSLQSIRDIEVKRLMLVCCLEYLYLYDNNFNFNELLEEFIEIFDFGNRTINSIKDKVKAAQALRGNSGLANKFGNELEKEIEDNFHMFIDNFDIENSDADIKLNIEELEAETISSVLHIRANEIQRFINKKIFIQAYIKCEGELIFENCLVQYNASEAPDRISLGGSGTVKFINCHVRCNKIDKDNGYFITCNNKNLIECVNSLFNNCINFIDLSKGSNIFKMEYCKIFNPMENFLYCWNHNSESASNLNHNTFVFDSKESNVLEHYASSHGAIILLNGGSLSVKECDFLGEDGSLLKDNELSSQNQSRLEIINTTDHTSSVIEGSSFIKITNILNSSGITKDCSFKYCENIYLYRDYDNEEEEKIVSNCNFYNCANIFINGGYTIQHTKFIGCEKNIISGKNYYIEYCEFINIKGIKNAYSYFYTDASLEFIIDNYKNTKTSVMKNCKFDGFYGDNSLLVRGSSRDSKNLAVKIISCYFNNCKTTNKDGKIIEKYDSYTGLFNRTIKTEPVSISMCNGLDKIEITTRELERKLVEDSTNKLSVQGVSLSAASLNKEELNSFGTLGVYDVIDTLAEKIAYQFKKDEVELLDGVIRESGEYLIKLKPSNLDFETIFKLQVI